MSDGEEREEELFEAALRLSAEQRAVFLGQACGSDEMLRQRVEALVTAFERSGGFLKQPAISLPQPSLPQVEKPGDRIGRAAAQCRLQRDAADHPAGGARKAFDPATPISFTAWRVPRTGSGSPLAAPTTPPRFGGRLQPTRSRYGGNRKRMRPSVWRR